METHGFHLLLDIWLQEAANHELVARIEDYIHQNFSVVAESRKEFFPQGLTSVLILSESHFSIHTYPEHKYISLDLYICNAAIDLNRVRDELLSRLKVEHYQSSLQLRGLRKENALLEQKQNSSRDFV